TLRIETPFTLLVEATAQFELQLPEHSEAIGRFHDTVRKFRDTRGALGQRKRLSRSRGSRISEVHSIDRELYTQFADLLSTIGNRTLGNKIVKTPVLVALDTFEEVQYRDRESLTGFWRMLDVISEAYPPFRVVISGRASVADLDVRTRQLDEMALGELVFS